MLGLLVGLALAWPAGATEHWERLYDSLLLESLDGDLVGAITGYERLVRRAPAGDPARSEALFWLGQTRLALGDVQGAREALLEGARHFGPWRARCLELLGRIELEQSAVSQIPVRWTFDGSEHGFTHPWTYHDKGTIRIEREAPGGGPALRWTTTVDRRDDRLVVGFRPTDPAPSGLRFRAWATDLDAHLRLVVHDAHGRQYVAEREPVAMVATDRWTDVTLHLDGMQPLDPADPPFQVALIERLVILDVTAYFSRTGGENGIYIAAFEVW